MMETNSETKRETGFCTARQAAKYGRNRSILPSKRHGGTSCRHRGHQRCTTITDRQLTNYRQPLRRPDQALCHHSYITTDRRKGTPNLLMISARRAQFPTGNPEKPVPTLRRLGVPFHPFALIAVPDVRILRLSMVRIRSYKNRWTSAAPMPFFRGGGDSVGRFSSYICESNLTTDC